MCCLSQPHNEMSAAIMMNMRAAEAEDAWSIKVVGGVVTVYKLIWACIMNTEQQSDKDERSKIFG